MTTKDKPRLYVPGQTAKVPRGRYVPRMEVGALGNPGRGIVAVTIEFPVVPSPQKGMALPPVAFRFNTPPQLQAMIERLKDMHIAWTAKGQGNLVGLERSKMKGDR